MKAKIVRMSDGASVYPLYEITNGLTTLEAEEVLNSLGIKHDGIMDTRGPDYLDIYIPKHTAKWMILNIGDYDYQECFCMVCDRDMDIKEARRLIKENLCVTP